MNQSLRRKRSAAPMPMAGRVMIWVIAVVGLAFVGLVVLSVAFVEFLDCSNPEIHESAATPLGWMVASIATLGPVAVAWRLTGLRHWLLWLALGVAAVESVAWVWLIDPGDCEWQ